METPYRAVDFAEHEVITLETMNQISNNLQWIHDNTPRSRFFTEVDEVVTTTDERMVILFGRINVGQSRKNSTVKKKVSFAKSFAPDCLPNVTTGVIARGAGNVFCVVNGPKGSVLPTARGCEIVVTAPHADDTIKKRKWQIAKPIVINWQAYGIRSGELSDV